MAKITANGEREIARWTGEGGAVYVLTEKPDGRPGRFLHKWTRGVTFTIASIVVDRKPNGGPVYSERPTLEQADAHARARGYERKPS